MRITTKRKKKDENREKHCCKLDPVKVSKIIENQREKPSVPEIQKTVLLKKIKRDDKEVFRGNLMSTV